MNPSWKTENFPNLARLATIQVQEIESPTKVFLKRATAGHITIRNTRVEMKKKNAKDSQRERSGYLQRKAHQTHSGSLQKPYKPEESGGQYSTFLKNFQPRISHPAKLSFISEGERKSFMDKQLLRDFVSTRPALQELLKEALNKERNNQYQSLQKRTKW